MSQFLDLGSKLSLTGTALATAYTAGSLLNVGNGARRIRFYVKSVRTNGSGATTTTIKLQTCYADNGSDLTGYTDLPSNLDDVQGAAQPKGPTLEIEHVFTTSANATTYNTFYLDFPNGTKDMKLLLKVNSAGQTTDNTTIYAVVG